MKIRVSYKATAPISHIGETASIGSYFNTIQTSGGKLPVITANSVRGTLRDCGAKYLLDMIGVKVGKEIFHVLFSGGNINGTMKQDVKKNISVRQHFPFVSLFGGGLGDMIMSGKMSVGNLYPVCKETYEMLGCDYTDTSWKSLIDEIEFTRTDDGKNDLLAEKYISDNTEAKKAKASTQMRYSVQYMAQGTEFVQDIYLFDNCIDEELGALFSAFIEWFKRPILGGMSNKGFGSFDAEVTSDVSDSILISVSNGVARVSNHLVSECLDKYNSLIGSEKDSYLELLGSVK